MPRQSLGDRVQVNLRVPTDLLEKIDDARDSTSRNDWMVKAAQSALGTPKPDHKHKFATLIGSRYRVGGERVKVMQCSCGENKEVPR